MDETLVLANARVMVEKYKPLGYDTLVLDGGWIVGLDEFGRLQVNTRSFPRGIKPLVADLHAMGLKVGVHTMRGIPRAAWQQNLPVHGTAYRAKDIADPTSVSTWSNSHYGLDMTKPGAQAYYDDWIALLASYDVDYIKADDLVQFPREAQAVIEAVAKVARPITLALSPGGNWDAKAMPIFQRAATMRITADVWDKRSDLSAAFRAWHKFSESVEDPANPGVWPDLDMAPLGHLRGPGGGGRRPATASQPASEPASAAAPAGAARIVALRAGKVRAPDPQWAPPPTGDHWCNLTAAQKRTAMTQRSMAASALVIGGALVDMDAESFGLLTNVEMIACNQNAVVGRRVHKAGTVEVWQTPKRGATGEGWIGVFNRDVQPLRVRLTADQLGLHRMGRYHASDIWNASAVSIEAGGATFDLGADDVCFFSYRQTGTTATDGPPAASAPASSPAIAPASAAQAASRESVTGRGTAADPVLARRVADTMELMDDRAWAAVGYLPAPASGKPAGSVQLCWNDRGIMGRATVADVAIVTFEAEPWLADSLELFIERGEDISSGRPLQSAQWVISPWGPDGRAFLWVSGDPVPDEKVFPAFWRRMADGYVLYFQLSAEALGRKTLQSGSRVRLLYAVNDDGLAIEQFTADKDLDGAWRRPECYGVIELAP
jgi:hypothetical protein